MRESFGRGLEAVEIPEGVTGGAEKFAAHIVVNADDGVALAVKMFDSFRTIRPLLPVTRTILGIEEFSHEVDTVLSSSILFSKQNRQGIGALDGSLPSPWLIRKSVLSCGRNPMVVGILSPKNVAQRL